MKRVMLLAAVVLFALAALLPGLAAPAQAQTTLPPSLVGETFHAREVDPDRFGEGTGAIDVTAICNAEAGETFTMTYSASGVATGPYPGTFRETGTVTATLTAGAGGFAQGVVTTWTASFTIDSPAAPSGPATVTGTKTLKLWSSALCTDPFLGFAFDQEVAQATLSYDATLKTASGRFRDRGEASALVFDSRCTEPTSVDCTIFFWQEQEYFLETFIASTGVLPVDTHGKATGGGQILSGSDPLERVTFGFNVRKDPNETRLKGTCNVLDHATNTHVKCLNVTDYQQIGNTATWEGTAEVNGVVEDYRITVQDNGEPNQGLDTFSIKTDSYEAAGNVQHGNVQLHKQALTPLSGV